MVVRPSGQITFLFSDIEGSTQLWERQRERMPRAFRRQEDLQRQAFAAQGGYAYKMVGDAFQAAFETAPAALTAAVEAQRALAAEQWGDLGPLRVRMALHTGIAEERGDDYVGPDLNRLARLLAAAHGGQVLLTLATAELVRDQLPADVRLLDLGEHRLRDLSRPEHIFEAVAPGLPAEFPPLKTLDTLPNNLPLQLTHFVGRARELAEIKQLLSTTRLLTLTGAGGCGKTRLALQAAADLMDTYPDGAWLVELAALSDPTLVPQAVAKVWDVREQPGRPLLDALADYLQSKNLLLVLDNCEHLIEACARMADGLLRADRLIKILATSREELRIAGEVLFHVPSLSLPDRNDRFLPASISGCDAVQLFVERAHAARPAFSLTEQNAASVAWICRRLDGIPLAIELAAARVRVLSVEQIEERLDSRLKLLVAGSRAAPPRHQTLRAAIDWSYNLLSEPQQRLFWRLSVFAGGWSIEAAQAVGGQEDILEPLSSLVDKSLVTADAQGKEARYHLLQTIRDYAVEKLTAAGERERMSNNHLDWFVELAERAEPELWGPDQVAWLDRLEAEHDNLLAALDWSLPDGQADENDAARVEKGLRLACALGRFWQVRGYFNEGRDRLTRLMARPEAQQNTLVRARALRGGGTLALAQGDLDAARSMCEESLSISRAAGGGREEAEALLVLGEVALRQGRYPLSSSLFTEAQQVSGNSGFKSGEASSLLQLGLVAAYQVDYDLSRALFEQSLGKFRELGDRTGIAAVLMDLGLNLDFHGDYELARTLHEESLVLWRELRDKRGIARALDNLGYITLHEGNYAGARPLFAEALSVFADIGNKAAIADVLEGLAGVAAAEHQPERGARLCAAALALLEASGAEVDSAVHSEYDRNLGKARSQLDEAAFNAAWAEGRALTLEQAIQFALEQKPGSSELTASRKEEKV